jgi:DNA-binding LytR/AlgR family response regulator
MKCYLLDDEIPSLKYLKILSSQIQGLEVVKAFSQPEKLLEAIVHEKVDLCIIDIHMPNINGLQLAQKLKEMPIIFVTAFKEFAADAFDLHAIDYIRKPLTLTRLEEAINKAKIFISASNTSTLQLLTDHGIKLINIADIVYIQNSANDRRDKILYLKSKEEIKLKNISFDDLKSKLGTQNLIRISKSTIISTHYLSHYTLSNIYLKLENLSEISFPLSQVYKETFLQTVKSL